MIGLAFTYGCTYGGAVVSLVNPFAGLLIYVMFSIVRPHEMWFWSVEPGSYSRIVAIALLLGWLAKGTGSWQLGRARGIVLALVFFWVWGILGALQASDQTTAWNYVEERTKIVLPFLVGITTIDSMRKVKILAWVVLLTQGYVAMELNQSYFAGMNRIEMVGFAGVDNNGVAVAMVAAIGLAFFCGLHSDKWWTKALGLGSAALMVHVVLFSFSRGGMLALIVSGVAIFVLIPKTPRYYLLFALGLLLVVRLAGPEVQARFQTVFVSEEERDGSAQSRISLWANCLDSVSRHPIFGVGPGHWPLVVHQYGWAPGKAAHTMWLETAAELGIPGLLFLALFYGGSVKKLWGFSRESSPVLDPWSRYFARMVIASTIGFAVAAQFISCVGLEAPYFTVLVGAGALKLTRTRDEVLEQEQPVDLPRAEEYAHTWATV